eukprot:scaffold22597_cov127-Cylindrotheca_fusiformis.AAC.1
MPCLEKTSHAWDLFCLVEHCSTHAMWREEVTLRSMKDFFSCDYNKLKLLTAAPESSWSSPQLDQFGVVDHQASRRSQLSTDAVRARTGSEQRRGREGGGAPEAVHEVEQQPELILLASSKQ